MNLNEMVTQLELEGFQVAPPAGGFIIGTRRRSPRFVVLDVQRRTMVLYDQYDKMGPLLKKGDLFLFEVEYQQADENSGIVAVHKVLEDAPADIEANFLKMEQAVLAVARSWKMPG